MKTFVVTAERNADGWWTLSSEIGTVLKLRRLDQIEDEIYEAVTKLTGIDKDDVDIKVEVELTPRQRQLVADFEASRVIEARAKTRREEARLNATRGLSASGLSEEDIELLLGLNHYRPPKPVVE